MQEPELSLQLFWAIVLLPSLWVSTSGDFKDVPLAGIGEVKGVNSLSFLSLSLLFWVFFLVSLRKISYPLICVSHLDLELIKSYARFLVDATGFLSSVRGLCRREKMVAALIALGASAGAVTDPTSQDPIGKTPASIAANSGHKGLAGYLSEVALTSHLSSLTIEESELSKGSAEVEAERTVDAISKGSFAVSEDQVSLKDTLAAVRNAAQAAARIQSAFRAHSFRKRQEREAATSAYSIDEYGVNSSDIQGLSAMSKLAFRNARDYNSAALSIQKKYRGWKGRKDFLAFRQKVVKIQVLYLSIVTVCFLYNCKRFKMC